MEVLEDKSVFLEQGEPVPVFCGCGAIYQPKEGSDDSYCPRCNRNNDHNSPNLTVKMREIING